MTRAELDQVWYAVTFALASEYSQRGWLPPGRRDDLAEHIKSIADDCREDFNTCPQCGYEDHTAIKNSNLLLLIDSALSRPTRPVPR